MKTNRLLWIIIVAFAVLFLPYGGGAHIRSDKRIKIAEDTCFYMASGADIHRYLQIAAKSKIIFTIRVCNSCLLTTMVM